MPTSLIDCIVQFCDELLIMVHLDALQYWQLSVAPVLVGDFSRSSDTVRHQDALPYHDAVPHHNTLPYHYIVQHYCAIQYDVLGV